MSQHNKAISLVEFLIVVSILGIVTAYGVPNYSKAISKADERNMIANLRVIRTAVDLYTQYDEPLGNWGTTQALNQNFMISLTDTKANYSCTSAGSCTASHTNGGWSLNFNDTLRYIHCSSGAGTCPSCPVNPSSGDCSP